MIGETEAYAKLYGDIAEALPKDCSIEICIAIMQEIAKDKRTQWIQRQKGSKSNNKNKPWEEMDITPKQAATLKEYTSIPPGVIDNMSKQEAHDKLSDLFGD